MLVLHSVKRINTVPVAIDDFDRLFCAMVQQINTPWFEVPPTPAFQGVGPIGFGSSSPFPGP